MAFSLTWISVISPRWIFNNKSLSFTNGKNSRNHFRGVPFGINHHTVGNQIGHIASISTKCWWTDRKFFGFSYLIANCAVFTVHSILCIPFNIIRNKQHKNRNGCEFPRQCSVLVIRNVFKRCMNTIRNATFSDFRLWFSSSINIAPFLSPSLCEWSTVLYMRIKENILLYLLLLLLNDKKGDE